MTRWAIVDTGPLVAFLDRRERHHAWAVEHARALKAPLLVCESVLTEAMFLLSGFPAARKKRMHWLEQGALTAAVPEQPHLGGPA